MTKPDSAKMWRVALAGYWLALFVGTHLPKTFPGLPREQSDKLVHAAAFAGLAWLLAMAWDRSTGRLTGRHLRFAWMAIAVYAAADEATQSLVGRTGTLGDWLADVVGAGIGLLMFFVWNSRSP